jgi:hypothetical protein
LKDILEILGATQEDFDAYARQFEQLLDAIRPLYQLADITRKNESFDNTIELETATYATAFLAGGFECLELLLGPHQVACLTGALRQGQ